MNSHRRRTLLAACAALTVAAGLTWRFAIPGLPWFAWKYGGSVLWASLVYFLLASLLPRSGWRVILAMACVTALGVEFSRLADVAWLNAFRGTLAGRLTIGAVFSLWNLPAYFAGAGLAALIDVRMLDQGRR
ncbi:MAG: DUF2809 domain-containing protein [Beijerinckiaceae bacterium]